MTTPDYAHLSERLQAARAELTNALEQASRDLLRYKRESAPTPEDRQKLQEAALRGDLGDDMRELARKVDRGEDNWDAIFSGESPNAGALKELIKRTITENRDAIKRGLEERGFDPSRPLEAQDFPPA